jgi:hypothetical protein
VTNRAHSVARLIGITLATVAFLLPLAAFALALIVIDGHASLAYYEAVAQIIPIIILALAIELRYFGREMPEPLRATASRPELIGAVSFVYAAITLGMLIVGEGVSLWVIAEGASSQLQLSVTTAGLTAGAVAMIVAILLPTTSQA